MLVSMDSAHVITGCKAAVHVMPASNISAKAATPSGVHTHLLLISLQVSVSSVFLSAAAACQPA